MKLQDPLRFIGIRHRVKKTAAGEARPTQVTLMSPIGIEIARYELATVQDELAFIHGVWRPRAKAKPVGLAAGDVVAMSLGGSGDTFAHALTLKGMKLGAQVWRMPTHALKQARGDQAAKDEDPTLMAALAIEQPDLYYETGIRDMAVIKVREAWQAVADVRYNRIGCQQRLHQRAKDVAYTQADDLYEEDMVEKTYDRLKATDRVLAALELEEQQRLTELNHALGALDIYNRLFVPIVGLGPAIAARLIGSIYTIRRFRSKHALKAYCGVHVLPDGRFPRQRRGEVCNWTPNARQALYLFGDQLNRRPETYWGQRLLAYKAHFREVHPEVIVDEHHKQRYNNGHILRMAHWRTLTKFVEWLYAAWRELDAVPTAS